MSQQGDLVVMADAWDVKWGDTPPLGHYLRGFHPELWIRFHSLPESKRYAETSEEHETILMRHHTILGELGGLPPYFFIAPRWDQRWPDLLPAARPWRVVTWDPDGSDVQIVVDVIQSLSGDDVDGLLRAVADDQLSGLIIAPADLGWLYHPYDGGADVIAPSTAERDGLQRNYALWLPGPGHTHGL